MSDRDYARELAAAGQAHIKTHHSVSAMAEQTLKVYDRLAMRRPTYAMPT
ncbi:MAG: glycosyltransferase family 4 protein [bacterium]|nr:glycosyltransferase family 4 protein [bacterium]